MTSDWCPKDWELVKLSDLGEVNRGRSRHRPRYAKHLYDGPYPFIQTGDIKASGGKITTYQQTYSEAGLAQSRLWPAGTLCITIAANIAETGILTFLACFPDSVIGFVADDSKCDVRFVEYMFRYLRRRIQHEATGSVQDNINLATLDRLRFPLPPLSEQRPIAHILGTLDNKIELNKQMNRTLESIALAIFKSWFVDFDPVRAKMDGRQPYGMDAETAALFPDSFEDSPLGKIPKGWKTSQLEDVLAEVFSGSRPKGGVKGITEGVPSIGAENVLGIGKYDYSKTKYVPRLFFEGIQYAAVRNGDVLLYKDGASLGRKSYFDYDFPFPECCINEHVFILRTNELASQRYLYFWLDQPWMTQEIINLNTGSAQPGINKRVVATLPILLPATGVLQEFEILVGAMIERLFENCKQSRTLVTLRDTLLPKLLSGEIRVKDAEKFVEDNT